MHDSTVETAEPSRSEAFASLFTQLRPQIDALVAQYEEKRSALLPIIHLFQEHEGYVTQEAIRATSQLLAITPAVVESTVSFYTLFFRKPVGKYMLQVCRGLMCQINGADDIMSYFREKLGIANLETTDDGLFSYEEVECLAACDRPTCMQVNLEFIYDLTPAAIDELIEQIRGGSFRVKPMAQSEKPGRTWRTNQDLDVGTGRKSPGTRTSSRPNNAGGLGDASGVIMLDRFVTREGEFAGRSRERTVVDARGVADAREVGDHAGH
ncbi:MAG: NAD(P)H-dependent oxidoreductase subunit E [Candidatus Eremiobacteraeota bacterium]|nr:NAD(P)H-dependent oxidoreductase subunit E [Candidatus Eremiobacteraeota bacterium]